VVGLPTPSSSLGDQQLIGFTNAPERRLATDPIEAVKLDLLPAMYLKEDRSWMK
jgi:hypothetical protein